MKTAILLFALLALTYYGVQARTSGFACLAGQYVGVAGKVCRSCSPGSTFNGCLECDGKKCSKCADGWDLPTTDSLSCIKRDPSCATQFCDVSGNSACGECADGYRNLLDANSSPVAYCVACSQANAVSCSDTEATECRAGFFVDNKACTACKTNCAACSSATDCTECAGGFFLNGADCAACGAGCAECSSATACTTCAADNVKDSTGNACTASVGCEEGDGAGKCKTCRDGYRLKADGTCAVCDGNAQLCDGNGTTQTIVTCRVDYILQTATSSAAAKCAVWDGMCTNQDAAGVCSACWGTYVISKGACVTPGSLVAGCGQATAGDATTAATCSACAEGYFGSGSPVTSCTACPGGCTTCTSASACDGCQAGYFKNTSGTCTSCNAGGAKDCTLENASSCQAGYGIQTHGICFRCRAEWACKTCDGVESCLTCETGSDVESSSKKCVVCDPNCAESKCVNGAGTCSSTLNTGATNGCKTNWFPSGTAGSRVCVKDCKVAGCTTCDTTDYSKCTTCKTGFFLSNGACTACPTNCATCTSATVCTACKNGKIYDGTKQSPSDSCKDNCAKTGQTNVIQCTGTCNTATPSVCTTDTAAANVYTCATGYYSSAVGAHDTNCDTACPASCLTCTGANGNGCTCPDGKFVDNGACTACGDANATTCSALNTSTGCKTGYALGGAVCRKLGNCDPNAANFAITGDDTCANNAGCSGKGFAVDGTGKCLLACSTNCATCTDNTFGTCTTCKTGFCKSASKSSCIATPTTQNCAANSFDSNDCTKCTACATGYYLDAGACKPCPTGCTCSAANTCDTCRDAGQFRDTTANVCKPCTAANCAFCTAAVDKCDSNGCKAGYFLDSTGACVACVDNCDSCTDAKTCTTCQAKYFAYTFAADNTSGSAAYCAACSSNCVECTINNKDGKENCTACSKTRNHYLSSGKCVNANCDGSDGKSCTRCNYGRKLVSGACADCIADKTCVASCSGDTTVTPLPTTGGNQSSGDNGSNSAKLAFNLLILAFFAILGNMMI